jgi:hypothetical protein
MLPRLAVMSFNACMSWPVSSLLRTLTWPLRSLAATRRASAALRPADARPPGGDGQYQADQDAGHQQPMIQFCELPKTWSARVLASSLWSMLAWRRVANCFSMAR